MMLRQKSPTDVSWSAWYSKYCSFPSLASSNTRSQRSLTAGRVRRYKAVWDAGTSEPSKFMMMVGQEKIVIGFNCYLYINILL